MEERLNVLVVYNPASRLDRKDLERELEHHAPADASLIIRETGLNQSITKLIEHDLEWASLVVAAGGDGTVSGVAAGLLGSTIPLGIIPAGTTNMVSRINRVPGDLHSAVSLLFGDHRAESIDVGRCNGRVLLHMGGAGIDARIFKESSSSLKRRIGWLGYGPPAVRSLTAPSSMVSVTVNGTTITVASKLVLIANSSSLVHPRFWLYPNVRRDDGLFNVLIFTAEDATDMLSTAVNMALRRLHRSSHVIHLQGRRIGISAEPEMPFELDGDVIGETPFEVVVEPKAITVVCGL